MVQHSILIVEDDPDIRRTLEIALSQAGYKVIEAKDGREAMRLWHEHHADLVISDIHMPDKNGLEVLIEVRALRPSTPVIVMTDGGRSEQMLLSENNAKLLGAVRVVAKPFRMEEMLATVDRELRP
ncbi:MAG: two-component system, response regulator PdtaR [Gemmatimonadales bacterium]|jgi:DNA-binding response OmpR family regulator|nr:two-component system, response regulator PdtaR [Gemmatimonadales bacterium]